MEEENNETETYKETKTGKINDLLRDMEETVTKKKDKKMGQVVRQMKDLAATQERTRGALEATHKKLAAIEAELDGFQDLKESISDMRENAEQEEEETKRFETEIEERLEAVKNVMGRPSEIAVKLEREIKKTIPEKFSNMEDAVSNIKLDLEELKKNRTAEETQILEHRLGLLEEELKVGSERMDMLERLLESVKVRLSSTAELKRHMEELLERKTELIEKIELEEEKISSVELILTKLRGRTNELSEKIMTLEETIQTQKENKGVNPKEVIRLRREVLKLEKLLEETKAHQVSREELEEFEARIENFMERHSKIIKKFTE